MSEAKSQYHFFVIKQTAWKDYLIPQPQTHFPSSSHQPKRRQGVQRAQKEKVGITYGLLNPIDVYSFRASCFPRTQSSSGDINKNRNCHLLSNPMDAKWQQQVKQRPQLSEATPPWHVCATKVGFLFAISNVQIVDLLLWERLYITIIFV